MTEYSGSDGRTYTDEQIWERLEAGAWRVCCWDTESGTEWVVDAREDLLCLVPTGRPSWTLDSDQEQSRSA